MRFLHTADWHLGRLFHGVHLTDDQAHVLDQFVTLARESAVDAVVVSGDVYDRAVPPTDAVDLLDDTLCRLVLDVGVPVIVIAGNHDGADRLAFGSRLLRERGLVVTGRPSAEPKPFLLDDAHGPVAFVSLPYADPAVVRDRLGDEELTTHAAALEACVSAVLRPVAAGTRTVALAHAFVAGGTESESERPLAVGGAGAVPADVFSRFDYTALGHLHRPQSVGMDKVRYSGSLLKYSTSEAAHQKSVSLVEMDAAGACTVDEIQLTPRRDLRCLEGTLADILEGPKSGESSEDYVVVALTDTDAIFDAMGKVRQVYPNCLHVDRTAFLNARGIIATSDVDHRSRPPEELFALFFEEVTGSPATKPEAEVFARSLVAVRKQEREDKP